MDKPKTDKGKKVKRATRLGSISTYLRRYRQEIKEINMAKKYVNKKLKKRLNTQARELRARIKLLKQLEDNFSADVAFEVKNYYEKYGFEGVSAVMEQRRLFPDYGFLTMDAILDFVDWRLHNNKF